MHIRSETLCRIQSSRMDSTDSLLETFLKYKLSNYPRLCQAIKKALQRHFPPLSKKACVYHNLCLCDSCKVCIIKSKFEKFHCSCEHYAIICAQNRENVSRLSLLLTFIKQLDVEAGAMLLYGVDS